MAVVINEFEASVEAGGERAAGGSRAPGGDKPHEVRRKLRRAVVRALRIRP
ncbi:MAG TPA: hypothetical protein VE053_08250 [Allosphingosinicella sp.]|nr:hypothetical protein [Allosphingosinicella sp.]